MHKQMMDNNSYNIIMALASNLEALEAYHKYSQDGNQQLWQQVIQHQQQVIQLLMQQLPQVAQGAQSQGSFATQGGMGQSSQNYGSQSSGGSQVR